MNFSDRRLWAMVIFALAVTNLATYFTTMSWHSSADCELKRTEAEKEFFKDRGTTIVGDGKDWSKW